MTSTQSDVCSFFLTLMVPVVVCDNEVKTVLVFLNLSYCVS